MVVVRSTLIPPTNDYPHLNEITQASSSPHDDIEIELSNQVRHTQQPVTTLKFSPMWHCSTQASPTGRDKHKLNRIPR